MSSATAISIFTLGRKSTVYSLPAVDLRVALLPAEALHLGDGHALDAGLGQRLLNFFEFERLDDGDDEFHSDGVRKLPDLE